MKSGSLFWGAFFLGLGSLFLLDKYDSQFLDYSYIIDFWPIIFIFWGITIIVSQKIIKTLFVGFLGLLASLIVFSFFSDVTTNDGDDFFAKNDVYNYSEEYNPDIQRAFLELNTGAGELKLGGNTSDLISVKSFAEYNIKTDYHDTLASIQLDLDKNIKFWKEDFENDLKIALNSNPEWRIELNMGATSSVLDFSEYKLRKIFVNSGASKLKIKIGNKLPKVYVELNIAAAEAIINIDENSGCKLYGDNFLLSKDLPKGMVKIKKNEYISNNYENSENKVVVQVNGTVSKLKIRKY